MGKNKIKQQIIKEINRHLKGTIIKEDALVLPPSSEMGDLSLPCFAFSKSQKKSPNEIAKELKKKIKLPKIISNTQVIGPYLNFHLDKTKLSESVLKQIAKEKDKFGNLFTAKTNKKIFVEYISPNTNKPLHLGHLRNAFLGESISNILETQGFKVIRGVLNNDRGMGINKSVLMYKKYGKDDSPEKSGLKSDHFVGKYYVMYEKKIRRSENIKNKLEKELKELSKKWEEGDKEILSLWKKMNDWAQAGYRETYKKIGTKFDKSYFESKIYKEGKKIVNNALKKGIFEKDKDENVVAKFENMPDRVLLRKDGTAVYITNDLAYAKKVFSENKINKLIYVVGNEQELSFKQLFEIFKQLEWNFDCLHLNYGIVNLPEGRMKSREGTVVDADDLIEKLEDYATKEIKARHDFIPEKDALNRAESIALAALKYFILNVNPKNTTTYNPKTSLSFTGNTGPYLLYTYARISNILSKAPSFAKASKGKNKINFKKLETKTEHQIIIMLSEFENVLKKAQENYDPSEITRYLYELAKKFSDFYRDTRVIDAPKDVRETRLFFLACINQVFEKGLKILGIKPIKKM